MRYGLRLLSATESLDDISADKLMENQLAGFVQFDNDIRNERCRNGIGWSRPLVQAGTSGAPLRCVNGHSKTGPSLLLDAAQDTAKRLNLNPIAINQPSYNMLNRYIEQEVIPMCTREGMGIAVFSPLEEGVLTGKYKKGQELPKGSRAADPKVGHFVEHYLTEESLGKVERISKIALENNVTTAQLALAWILHHREISAVIIGASRPEQIEENVKAIDVTLDETTMEVIEEALTK